jgi:arylsulfatase A-like enzyme
MPHGEVGGSIMDIAPTLLYLAGLAVPEGLDGSVLVGAFSPEHRHKRPVRHISPLSSKRAEEDSPYSKEEAAVIEESLRGLGYL